MVYEIKRIHGQGTKDQFHTHLGFVDADSEDEAIEKMMKKYDFYVGTREKKDLNLTATRWK